MTEKKNYDSDFCGSLPLNHINVTQSYGYLFVLDNATFNILQISENCAQLLDKDRSAIVGSALNSYTDTLALQQLQERFANTAADKIPLTVTFGGKSMLAFAHFKPQYLLLEVEQARLATDRSFTSVFQEIKYAIAAIEAATTIVDVSKAAITELRKLTGFDGIMMYRFDEEWNGTVIAEEKVAGLEDYLGHTFPASDVPKQARELYLKNPYRLIPDRNYKPNRLFPIINPVTNAFIDLSDCNLRGVAAVHLEYLKNMNVQASMSIRVIHNNTLWGLIACHHLTPHYLNFELCSICELISTVISNRISYLMEKERFDLESNLKAHQTALIAQVYADDDIIKGLIEHDDINLKTLFNASGVVGAYRGQFYTAGEVPNQDMLENLLLWLQSKQVDYVFSTDHLPDVYDDALAYAPIASGAIAIPIDTEKGEYFIAFKPEVVKTINWGGNPNQTINFEPDGKKYHPRHSFKIWKEQVTNTSEAWSEQEIEVAGNLRTFLYEFTTKQAKFN